MALSIGSLHERQLSGVKRAALGLSIARRIASMSVSTAPSIHAEYTRHMVKTLCPCCFALYSGLLPIMRFQLTEVCRAAYGLR